MKKIIFILIFAVSGFQFFTTEQVGAPDLPQQISLASYSVSNGDLVLVNRDIALQGEPDHLATIPYDIAKNVVVNSEYFLEEQAISPLKQLFDAAADDGIEHFIINSAYRSGKLQEQLYEQYGADYSLPPGYSEHQTGLSIDIGSTVGKMENVEEGKWMEEHAAEFGYILRYPKDKVDITGIEYEPWHFRYIGLPHSVLMKQHDFVFEEYIAYLKEKQFYKMKLNDTTYFVHYTGNKRSVNTLESKNIMVSGDNVGGYIITSILEEI
ncbi:M15 family metallopeptidase [Solibacillus sp. FSL W7-1464]|uniref:M15 family metallopeptidase n=1 Tax=Solibacillus sp. FSL W7-1464 TaxID=2921706 RepID=UPI0030FBB371